jgi:hypothetical protein
MFVLLSVGAGNVIAGLVLSATPGRLRLSLAGSTDALEVVRRNGEWIAESGEVVNLGALLAVESKANHTMPHARSMAAAC